MGEALKIIAADPLRYVQLSVSRIPVYFQFWPSAESGLLSNIMRVLSFSVTLPFMLAGLALAARQWRRWSHAHTRRDEGPGAKIYPQITPISADLDMHRGNQEKESAVICEICG